MDRVFFLPVAFFLLVGLIISIPAEGQVIGVNYGQLGDNLPPPEQVVALLKSRNIKIVRLFGPNPTVLNALKGSGIEVVIGAGNGDLAQLSSDPSFAVQWIQTNIIPYADALKFRYILAGNEVYPTEGSGNNIVGALQNLANALAASNLQIPVTTAVSTLVLGASYPPSQGAFTDGAAPVMSSILAFLASKGTPLHVNIYSYYAFSKDVSLDYLLFTSPGVVVQDGPLGYSNIFDAILDAAYSAMEKSGGANVGVVVSETGWPSGGGPEIATVNNAKIYNNNLVAHVTSNAGTPKRPGKPIETYLFALFNEDEKNGDATEKNWGLYNADETEVYHVDFPN